MTRFAELSEMPLFESMLRLFLQEQQDSGSPVLFTRKTLDWYRDLGRLYLTGQRLGFVVLGEIESEAGSQVAGFTLAGEELGPPRFDTTLGKTGIIWLIWVAPEHRKSRLGLEMLYSLVEPGREAGFDTAILAVHESNQAGMAITHAFGAAPAERVFHFRVSKETE
jgi:ribosomal protein S18 acetylase RimI-like enzyme